MGLIIEKAKKNGFSFSLTGKQLSSKYDPLKEGQRILASIHTKLHKSINTSKKPLIIALGVFPIYHILYILQTFPNAKLLIFDNLNISKSDLKKAWNLIIEEHQKNINFNQLCFYSEFKSLLTDINQYSKEDLQSLVIVPSPYIETWLITSFQEHYLQIFKRKASEAKTIKHFDYIWDIHTLQNLKNLDNYKGFLIQNLFFNFEDVHFNHTNTIKKPVLFISSGPLLDEYLDKHLNELIAISKIIPLICVPAMARRLLQLGVEVTAIFTSDAGFPNSYHFMHLYKHQQSNKIPIIAPLSVHPNILRNADFSFCYCDLRIEDEKICSALGKANFISPDASVVLSGIRFLVHMGFKNIYTLGIDFAMYPFREHALSNTSEELWFTRHTRWENYSTLTHRAYHLDSSTSFKHPGKNHLTSNSVLKIYSQEYEKLTLLLKNNHISVQSAQELIKLNLMSVKYSNHKEMFLHYKKTPKDYRYISSLLKSYLMKKYLNVNETKNTARSLPQEWTNQRLKKI